MCGLRRLPVLAIVALALVPGYGAAADAATTCSAQPGRTIIRNAEWRVFDTSKKGVRQYAGTVRHSIRACRRGTTDVKRVAAWTDSYEDRTHVTQARIVGQWAAFGGEYVTGIAAGTFVQVVHLPVPSRTRIEGPLAEKLTALQLSYNGSIAVETRAQGIRSLDVYDRKGRRTLAMGGIRESWITGDNVYWNESDGMHTTALDGPAANELEIFASP